MRLSLRARLLALALAALCVLVHDALAAPDLADKFAMGSGGGTDHKPQSKLWFNDGAWWAIVFDGSSQRIWKFENGTFTKQTYADALVDARATVRADVLWDGTNLYVLAWHSTLPRFSKYAYDRTTQTYQRLAGFPVDLPIADTECMVFDKDSTGRLWISYELGHQIHVVWSTTADHLNWDLAGTVIGWDTGGDDISTTVAFGGNRIGVLWSDQGTEATWQFGFRAHRDADAPDVWQPLEIVDTGSSVDDHINLKAHPDGTLYFAGKDLYNHIQIYKRPSAGGWTRAASNINGGTCTRPSIELDLTNDLVHVFMTDWTTSPNPIHHVTAPRATLAFGGPENYLVPTSTLSLNDVTTAKHPVSASTGILAMAAGSSSAYWGFTNLDLDAPVITAEAPEDEAAGVELQPLVQIRVEDAGMGVRPSSIALTLDGTPITPSLSGDAQAYLVGWTPPTPLAAGRIYTLGLTVQDQAYPPHAASTSIRFKTAPEPLGDEVRVNFQPASGASPSGWDIDSAELYTLDAGSGWDKKPTPKRSNVLADVKLDTYVERKNSSSKCTWSYDVANGAYRVSLAAGSASSSGKQRVEVEGEVVFNNQATTAGQFLTLSDYPVVVQDGRLAVRIGGAGGSTYTQLCYVTFRWDGPPPPPPPSGDIAAPRGVTGTRVAKSGADLVLTWNPVSEDTTGALITVIRYHVYRGATPGCTPDRSGHSNRIAVVSGTSFTNVGAATGGADAYYIVTAERAGGVESQHVSNLAYRRRIHVDAPAGGATRSSWIALPAHAGFATAQALVADLNAGTGVLAVRRVARATQELQSWTRETGSWGGTNFALVPGEAVEIVTTEALDWDCIGAEPDAAVYGFAFHAAVGNVSWVSLPQNVAYADAGALVQALNGGAANGPVTKLAWLNPATAAMESYLYFAGAWRGSNFALRPGSGVAVLVGADLPSWTPRLSQP